MQVGSHIRRLLLFAALFACEGSAASIDSSVLQGQMSWWQQVLGYWTCEVTLESTEGVYPQKGSVLAVGTVAPDNVFHWHVNDARRCSGSV